MPLLLHWLWLLLMKMFVDLSIMHCSWYNWCCLAAGPAKPKQRRVGHEVSVTTLTCSIHCIFMLFWLWLPFQPPSLWCNTDIQWVYISPSDAIQSDGLVSSTVHQNQLSSKIDIHQFNNILIISSVADKARMLSVSSPHAASWLTVVPSVLKVSAFILSPQYSR